MFEQRYNHVIVLVSRIDPGSKVKEQFLSKKKIIWWVVANLPSIASINCNVPNE